MAKVLLLDLSRVLLFPKDELYHGELNALHRQMTGISNYKPSDYFGFEPRTMDFLARIKDKVPMYLFTTGTIQQIPEFKIRLDPIFKEVFSADEQGWSKKDVNCYRTIAEKIGKKPGEILFIDDQETNVEAARKAGMTAQVYSGFEALKKAIEENL